MQATEDFSSAHSTRSEGTAEVAEEPAPKPEAQNPALRLAGCVLILNALLVAAEKVIVPQAGGSGFLSGPTMLPSIVIDAALGISLLSGSTRYQTLAIVRCVLGLILFSALHLAEGEVLAMGFQFAFSCGLLMLMVGTPSLLRRGVALSGVGLCVLFEVAGLYALGTGGDLLGLQGLAISANTDDIADGTLQGQKFHFQMERPGESWRLRKDADARRDNPLADRWLIDTRSGAHIIIIGEKLPANAQVSMDRFADLVTGNLRKAVKNFHADSPTCSTFMNLPACDIQATGRVQGVEVDYQIRLLSAPDTIYQIIALGPSKSFSEGRPDVVAAIDSFRVW